MKRLAIWILLLVVSVVAHALISWRVGRDIEHGPQIDPVDEIFIALQEPPKPQAIEREPPEDKLEFEEEFELDPPEILVQPEAVTPPPPDVPLALKADSGGMEGFELANPISALPLGEGFGTAGFGRGIGNALGNSSNRFAAYLGGLRSAGLDVVFLVDATGSMDWVLDEVKTRIRDIVRTTRSLVPIARFGIVAFRDKEGPEWVTRVQPLTFSTAKLSRFLDPLEAKGGGDQYEAVASGMIRAVEDSGWRAGARQIIILVGDAPPTKPRMRVLLNKVDQFVAIGGTVSTLDVGPQANPALIEAKVGRKLSRVLYRTEPLYEFRVIADAGGGDYATLEGDIKVTKRLITLIMGDKFANEMRALLEVI
jgi:hypothetical protein